MEYQRIGCFLAVTVAAACFPLGTGGQELSPMFGRYQLDVWRGQDDVSLAFTS